MQDSITLSKRDLDKMLEDVAERAAKKAVREGSKEAAEEAIAGLFEKLGLDVSTPESRSDVRADFLFTRSNREGSEALRRHVRKTVWGAVVLAILSVIWIGFNAVQNSPPHLPQP